jgi:hypothetical protein
MLFVDWSFLGVVVLCGIAIFASGIPRVWRRAAIMLVFVSVCYGLWGMTQLGAFARDLREYNTLRISPMGPNFDDVASLQQKVAWRFIPIVFLACTILTAAAISDRRTTP